MKTLLTLLIAFYSLGVMAQKSDTIGINTPFINDGDIFIFTVGDVYKYMVDEANPWGDPVYHYLKIEDAENGWVKYTKSATVEGLENQAPQAEKSRAFYKNYLRRNEWERYEMQRPL